MKIVQCLALHGAGDTPNAKYRITIVLSLREIYLFSNMRFGSFNVLCIVSYSKQIHPSMPVGFLIYCSGILPSSDTQISFGFIFLEMHKYAFAL